MKIRVVKTASKAEAVQVVQYQNNKRVILKHLGSAHNSVELKELLFLAEEWMKDYSRVSLKKRNTYPQRVWKC